MSERYVVLSGCSGGGKSTLLAELARRGYASIPEPGRRIVEAEMRAGGGALPWIDLAAFAHRAIALALADREAAAALIGPVFFDRGLVDAAAALEYATGKSALEAVALHRYHHTVFLVPPWPEIFVTDRDRRHGLAEAIAEYERLECAYASLGYEIVILDRVPVGARADLVLAKLALAKA